MADPTHSFESQTFKFKITIQGFEKTMNNLDSIPGLVRSQFMKAMKQAVFMAHDFIAKYPEQNPGSEYTRTGNLGGDWTVDVGTIGGGEGFQSGIRATLVNTMPYAPFVQDEDRQTGFHKATGWRTIQMMTRGRVADAILAPFKKISDAVISRLKTT